MARGGGRRPPAIFFWLIGSVLKGKARAEQDLNFELGERDGWKGGRQGEWNDPAKSKQEKNKLKVKNKSNK